MNIDRTKAEAAIEAVTNVRNLDYVGRINRDGYLTLDGRFQADDLRALADAMDGSIAVETLAKQALEFAYVLEGSGMTMETVEPYKTYLANLEAVAARSQT